MLWMNNNNKKNNIMIPTSIKTERIFYKTDIHCNTQPSSISHVKTISFLTLVNNINSIDQIHTEVSERV